VTLDMMLPIVDGVAATEYIMAHCPTPILIVSSSTNRGEIFKTYDALAAGALDVVEKSGAGRADGEWERQLVATIKLIARVKVIRHPRAKLASRSASRSASGFGPELRQPAARTDPSITASAWSGPSPMRLVAIGASTGGPRAVVEVLRALPADFPLPILLVIHIADAFAATLAEWIAAQVPQLPVRLAVEPVPLEGQGVFLAPPGHHLIVRKRKLHLSDEPERYSCRPSVDVLFDSIAAECGAGGIGCLLTGMGQDGARGLMAIRRAGGFTIAQDEATSVVYGMPREAALLGGAIAVLPLDEIGPKLAALGEEPRDRA
jgi:two-component system chemotaxis response regulator CheB